MNTSINFIEHLKTRDGVREQFHDAQSFVERALGIKLTNIELVGLRKIAEQVVSEVLAQELDEHPDSDCLIAPGQEIPARFIQEFYGINPTNIENFFNQYDTESFKEFFRRRQASLHYP